ncbi:DUF7561 family protein [Halovenus salina]|uniref:Small CPxCG-related zinc finger protein n=1 Tax=Halovenus salina TaxID=1510225 RepID=A0ABD5W2H0_9EURY|nr:hypothetical protein [Halovenus salina]
MSREPCDGCGEAVTIGSASANLWSFNQESTGGLVLELADGTEHFLCHDCIDDLPDDREVTAADVEALSER